MIPRADSRRETDRQTDRAAEASAQITAAMTLLDGLEHRPASAHVAAFERVYQALTDALSSIDGV